MFFLIVSANNEIVTEMAIGMQIILFLKTNTRFYQYSIIVLEGHVLKLESKKKICHLQFWAHTK